MICLASSPCSPQISEERERVLRMVGLPIHPASGGLPSAGRKAGKRCSTHPYITACPRFSPIFIQIPPKWRSLGCVRPQVASCDITQRQESHFEDCVLSLQALHACCYDSMEVVGRLVRVTYLRYIRVCFSISGGRFDAGITGSEGMISWRDVG